MATLDLDFVRAQFPAFQQADLADQAFFENAGGSYACTATIERLSRYYLHNKVQPKHPHKAAMEASELMDQSRQRWAVALGLESEEVQFGPSTSINTYVLAQALSGYLPADSQVIVTNQDHEANSGAMRRMAEARGLTLHEWQVNPQTGQLEVQGLIDRLNDKTGLVCLPHCSNVVGQINPVADWTRLIKQAAPKAVVIVDGVSHAPHEIPDVAALGCDVYLFSLYKVYSVHQGLMAVRRWLLEALPNQAHYFNAPLINKRLTPAGPDHAQEAAAQGVLDYIEALDAHHGGSGKLADGAVARVNALWAEHEQRLRAPLLAFLAQRNDLRLIGQAEAEGRHGTIGFAPHNKGAWQVAADLGARGLCAGSGHFYAARLLDHMGVGADKGVTRLSLVHYNSPAEIDALIQGLEESL